jgi:hypothetical protein
MTEQELERRLQGYFRAETDGEVASGSLLASITAIPERRPAGPFASGRGLLLLAAAGLILALLAGSALAIGSGLIELPWQHAPTLINQAPASPVPLSTPAAVAPPPLAATTPTPSLPSASAPASVAGPWTTLDLQPLQAGPPAGAWVVSWSGGYLALVQSGNPHYDFMGNPVGAGPLDAWTSPDGRTWTELPADTFGPTAFTFGAAPLAGGVEVFTQLGDRSTTAWSSNDGVTWTSSPAPAIELSGGLYPSPPSNQVAGGPGGVVAMSYSNTIEFSADGRAWQGVTLPGFDFNIGGVAAFDTNFVAFGVAGPSSGRYPATWLSEDGLHWTRTGPMIGPGPVDYLGEVQACTAGLVALGQGGLFSGDSIWTSADGRSWSQVGTNRSSPEGVSATGWLVGDGNRLLWYSNPADGPTVYLTSFDGVTWTKLNLTGDTSAATSGQVTPFLTHDGILFIGADGAWFGSAGN